MYFPILIASYGHEWKELDDEGYRRLRLSVPQLPEEKPRYGPATFWGDLKSAQALAAAGIDFDVPKEELLSQTGSTILTLIDKLADGQGKSRPENLGRGGEACVQIAVPDLGLLSIEKVYLLENACTDTLQDYLEQGWRIIAVCPPNSQRRPDYILGRSK